MRRAPDSTRRRGLFAPALALALALACHLASALATAASAQTTKPSPSERSDRMATTAPADRAICLGRFSFTLPEGWTVAGRDQKIYFSRVTDDLRRVGPAVPLPGLSPTTRVLRGDLPLADPVIREFALDGVGPAAWFGLGSPTSTDRRLVVLGGSPDGGVRLETLATAGREEQSEKGLRQLAAGYRPGARTGFCLPHGAITLDPSRNENTRLAADHPRLPGAELRFSTVTTSKPRTDGPLADPLADAQAMVGSGSSLKPLSQTDRTVAGLAGRDARAELQEPKKPATLVYRYFFPGIAGNAAAPEMVIALDGPASGKAALDAAWNQLLDSVRPVPLR